MMKKEDAIKLFEDKKVRVLWDGEKEKWFLSIIDVIEILTDSDRPRKYWSDLKAKLKQEGSELSEKVGQLKMQAPDGKMRMTDVADTEQLFRLIQLRVQKSKSFGSPFSSLPRRIFIFQSSAILR